MAKKNVTPITIKDEELVPTTLGVYKNKGVNSLLIFLILGLFLAIAFFMPNIQSYVNKMLGKNPDGTSINNNTNNNQNNNDHEPDPDTKQEVVKYLISSDTTAEGESIIISNISLDGATLNLTISTNSDSSIVTDELFLELFDDSNTFLGNVKLGNYSVSKTNPVTKSYVVNSSPTQFTISKKTEADYPQIDLVPNDNGEATLTCSSDKGTYTYEFLSNQLIKETFTYSMSNDLSDLYNQMLTKYTQDASRYNAVDGVTSSVLSNEQGFTFTYSVNPAQTDLTSLSDNNLFASKTKPSVVKFITEAQGLKCN